MHFNELKRLIEAILAKMLAATLKALVRDGFVTRHATKDVPPRFRYDLTPFGRDLLLVVRQLAL